jgi:anionic cell wall polymer biosynthesis LytR-Cps2A-Psr (LCP) family protein
MYKGNSSRILPIVIILIIVAIAIAALVSVGRLIFGGGETAKPETDGGQTALLDTSLSHSVRMTVRGPIVADENFRSYQVTVDPTSRNLTTYSGYLDQAIDTKQLSNNTKAYEQFVYALNNANMEKGTALTGDKDDTRGVCATGNVYEFDVLNNGNSVKHLWTSTCRGSTGSFKASVTQVERLFLNQIPDNQALLNKINF